MCEPNFDDLENCPKYDCQPFDSLSHLDELYSFVFPMFALLDENGETRQATSLEDILQIEEDMKQGKHSVASTLFLDGATVSTVFLHIQTDLGIIFPPSQYETMVFGGVFDGEMKRYATRDEAVIGHAELVELIKDTGNTVIFERH